MSQTRKLATWEVFNTPLIEHVQYYSILKKKRECCQLIKQNANQVFQNRLLHYCCIVPKNFTTNLGNEYEIFISFFDERPHSSFIGFQVQTSKETFIHEVNLLLFFLKKSRKAIFYLMNNNIIYVKCSINVAWELFYHLYEDYLRRHIVSVIGTQFYYSIFYSQLIHKEILLLELLYRGSKVVKISKKSVFYKIHKKRKLSVSEIVYTTHNMPKNKKYALSCFRFKKLPVTFSRKNTLSVTKHNMKERCQIFAQVGASTSFKISEDMSSSLCSSSQADSGFSVADMSKQHNQQNQLSLKRKFEEIDKDVNEIATSHTLSKCFNVSELKRKEGYIDNWKKYTNFKPHAIKKYSDIPTMMQLAPYLLSDSSKPDTSINSLFDIPLAAKEWTSASSIKERNATKTILAMKNIYEFSNPYKGLIPVSSKEMSVTDHKFTVQTNDNIDERSRFSLPKLHISQFPISDSFSENFPSQIIPLSDTLETSIANPGDINFSTAAGKEIRVPDEALVAAHKIMQDLFCEKTQSSTSAKIFLKEDKGNAYSFKNSCNFSRNKTASKKDSPKKFTVQFSNKKYFNRDTNINEFTLKAAEDNISFTTAGGKNINVSNTAMLEAEKIMQEVYTDERQIFEGDIDLGSCKDESYHISSAFKNTSCSPKKLVNSEFTDIDMDGTLVEKFFESMPFDEKELEQAGCANSKNLKEDSKSDKNIPAYKPRKSLGGRRNMRYSEKL